ncbi:hypothetical protein ACFL5J_00570 [Thermodesulfobacteriota bacterium]
MDGAQITILVIAGIIIAFFVKYKITGSIKNDVVMLGRLLERCYGYLAVGAMLGALMSAFCGVMLIYSLLTAPTASAPLTITDKEHKYHGVRYGHSYTLFLNGEEGSGKHLVSGPLYDAVQEGDSIRVMLSRFFHEWRQVEVWRDNRPIYRFDEGERVLPALFALLFLAPLSVGRLYGRFKKERILGSVVFIFFALFELIPLGILVNR